MRTLTTARLVLLATVAIAASIVLAPVRSLAAQPEFYTRYDKAEFENPLLTEDCDFPVIVAYEGAVKGRNYFDKRGKLIRNVETYSHHYRHTYINPATGTSLTTSAPAVFRFDYNAAGTGGTFTITGLQDNVTVAGKGSVFRDAGKVVLKFVVDPATGWYTITGIVWAAGRHDYVYHFVAGEHERVQGLCAALAG